MNRKNRGFTLLELLAAVIVIGIIGSIAMPIYTRITDEAKDNLFRDNIKSLVKNIRTIEVIEYNRSCGCIDNLEIKGTRFTGYWKLIGEDIVLYELSDGVRSVEEINEEELTTNFDISRSPIEFKEDCNTICSN